MCRAFSMNNKAKQIDKEIKELAAQMPVSYYEAPASCGVLGKDLMKQGVTEFKGESIDENKFYSVTEGWLFPVNHYRQMKKAYEQSGKDGLVEYVKGQNAIHRPKPLKSYPSVQW